MKILLIISIILVLFCLYLIREARAVKWMTDPQNVNRLLKHYRAEGATAFDQPFGNSIGVTIYHQGITYAGQLNYHNAIKYMKKTPNGGIRKILIDVLK